MTEALPGSEDSLEGIDPAEEVLGDDGDQGEEQQPVQRTAPLYAYLLFSMLASYVYTLGVLLGDTNLYSFLVGHMVAVLAQSFLLAHQAECNRAYCCRSLLRLPPLVIEYLYMVGLFLIMLDVRDAGLIMYWAASVVATVFYVIYFFALGLFTRHSVTDGPRRKLASALMGFLCDVETVAADSRQYTYLRATILCHIMLQVVSAQFQRLSSAGDRLQIGYWAQATLFYLLAVHLLMAWRLYRYGLSGCALMMN